MYLHIPEFSSSEYGNSIKNRSVSPAHANTKIEWLQFVRTSVNKAVIPKRQRLQAEHPIAANAFKWKRIKENVKTKPAPVKLISRCV